MNNKQNSLSFSSKSKRLTALMLLLTVGIAVSSCNSDDDEGPDTSAQFVGEYDVEDISQGSGYVYNYAVSISTAGTNQIQISNFADLFNVPVKANVNGMSFSIPKQTFTNPSGKSISVSGTGSLNGDVLSFEYTTTGYLDYIGTCEAKRYN